MPQRRGGEEEGRRGGERSRRPVNSLMEEGCMLSANQTKTIADMMWALGKSSVVTSKVILAHNNMRSCCKSYQRVSHVYTCCVGVRKCVCGEYMCEL